MAYPAAARNQRAEELITGISATRRRGDATSREHPQRRDNAQVLLVDDEDLALRVLGHRLEREGFNVTPVDDPIMALRKIHARPGRYRVVVTDLTMPKMSGIELARSVRAVSPATLVILHSSDTTSHPPYVDLVVPKFRGISQLIDGLAKLLERD
ncbi:MAG: response regulator [Polyangiaceae bacterium]|nr:response regulator [Polyangiaceae bacterium]